MKTIKICKDLNLKSFIVNSKIISKYFKWFNDRDVNRFLELKKTDKKENVAEILKEIIYYKNEYFFIVYKNEIIGHVGRKSVFNKNFIGYVIGEKYFWNKKIAKKCVKFFIEKLKNNNSAKIFAKIHKENTKSIQVAKYAGFVFEETIDKKWEIFSIY